MTTHHRCLEITSRMLQIGDIESPELQTLWSELERIKNEHGGAIPTLFDGYKAALMKSTDWREVHLMSSEVQTSLQLSIAEKQQLLEVVNEQFRKIDVARNERN